MRTFPARFRRETLISGWFPARTPLTSGKNPVKGTCRIFPFPRTVKFRPEYCFHLPVLFRPEVRGNLQESAGKNAVSCGIRPDPVTGIIDLGNCIWQSDIGARQVWLHVEQSTIVISFYRHRIWLTSRKLKLSCLFLFCFHWIFTLDQYSLNIKRWRNGRQFIVVHHMQLISLDDTKIIKIKFTLIFCKYVVVVLHNIRTKKQ